VSIVSSRLRVRELAKLQAIRHPPQHWCVPADVAANQFLGTFSLLMAFHQRRQKRNAHPAWYNGKETSNPCW
jgi:hypothetical protein